jgi:hypothetical protein
VFVLVLFLLVSAMYFFVSNCFRASEETMTSGSELFRFNLSTNASNSTTITSLDTTEFGNVHFSDLNATYFLLLAMLNASNKITSHPIIGSPMKNPIQTCTHRKNKIIWSFNYTAGINDRLYILSELADLAGYYCATPVVSVPAHLLSLAHNKNETIDLRVEWSHFQDLRWIQDGTEVLQSSRTVPYLQDYMNNDTLGWYTAVVHFNWSNFETVFQEVDEFLVNHPDEGFLVELAGNWYDNTPKFLKWKDQPGGNSPEDLSIRMMKSNVYTKKRESRAIEMIAEEFQGYENPVFLHIRRGDTVALNECDNSLPKIKDFILCSLKDTDSFGKLTILVASDERDPNYRREVKSIIEDNFNHTVALDVDDIVQTKINQAIQKHQLPEYLKNNNFFLFKVGQSLQWRSRFQLHRRRALCLDCQPLI